jgi:prolyl-tRNA synthetase
MAPFQFALIPIGMKKSTWVRSAVEKLYAEISDAGIEVLLDDRDDRPGVMFADMELIGIPHRIVVGERGLKEGNVEYQGRRDSRSQAVAVGEIVPFVKARLAED